MYVFRPILTVINSGTHSVNKNHRDVFQKKRLAIYAIHPIMYQTPIFRELTHQLAEQQLPIEVQVLFGDDLSLRPVYY